MIDTATELLAELLRLKEGLAEMLYDTRLTAERRDRLWLKDRISRINVLELRAQVELGLTFAPKEIEDPL